MTLIDKWRLYRKRLIWHAAILVVIQFAGLVANAQVAVTISVPKTEISEGSAFKATITVQNTGVERANDVYIYSGSAVASLGLDDGWTGYAQPTDHVRPLITAIGPGKTMRFTQNFKATTTGTFRLTCFVATYEGDSEAAYSQDMAVIPRKVGKAAQSDTDGTALVTIGKIKIPVHMTDEETGSDLSGLVMGLALDGKRRGQAVLSVTDPAGRYPTQFYCLQGPAGGPGEAPPGAAQTGGAKSAAASNTLQASAPSVLEVPIDQPCGGGGEVLTDVMAPITTSDLPTLENLPDVPAPKPVDDHHWPDFDVWFAALKASLTAESDFAGWTTFKYHDLSNQKLTCDQVLTKDGDIVGATIKEAAVMFIPKKILLTLAPALTGPVLFIGSAGLVSVVANTAHDLAVCSGNNSSIFVQSGAYFGGPDNLEATNPFYWNSPVTDDGLPIAMGEVTLNATDENGNPISGGSLTLVSPDNLGSGFRAVIGDGNADVPVPLDDYNWCVRAPGFQTQTGQVSVTATSNIQVALQPQPIASATLTTELGQPTGFLAKGTQFVLTPHFFDANGNEVSCPGTPVFQVHNPVGADVASVDPDTGLVTILDGCGAAKVTAWCGGVESAPALISSNCNGTQPLPSSPSFAVFPTEMTFVAKQGGSNPPSQSLYWVILDPSGTINYHVAWSPSSWLTYTGGSSADTVSVNISGLLAGTYSGTISIKDNANPKFHTTVHVNLIIEPVPTANVAGTWRGTYTVPYDDVGDEAEFNVVWVLDQNGNSVSGEYGEIEFGSTQQTNGELNDGLVEGSYFSIYNDGGLEFVGTVAGNTISGQVNTGTNFPGTFSVTRK